MAPRQRGAAAPSWADVALAVRGACESSLQSGRAGSWPPSASGSCLGSYPKGSPLLAYMRFHNRILARGRAVARPARHQRAPTTLLQENFRGPSCRVTTFLAKLVSILKPLQILIGPQTQRTTAPLASAAAGGSAPPSSAGTRTPGPGAALSPPQLPPPRGVALALDRLGETVVHLPLLAVALCATRGTG